MSIDVFPDSPLIRAAAGLADYSARRIAPVILDQAAAEIEGCGRPVIPGSEATEWQSLPAIAGSFRQAAEKLRTSGPLVTMSGMRGAYKLLDGVRTGAAWVDWPRRSGDPGGRIQDHVVSAEMPASVALAMVTTAEVDPRVWAAQFSGTQDTELARLLGCAFGYVRQAATAARTGGFKAGDIDVILDQWREQ